MTHLIELASMLKSLVQAYTEHVPAMAITNLITADTPQAVADRLGILAEDYPAGVPVDLVDLERRRAGEMAHMVSEGLLDQS